MDVQQSILDTLTAIAETNGAPAVFHCSFGKDRTGLISAMLLGILGVSEADIVADYARSADAVPQIVDRMRSDPATAAWIDSMPPQIFQALPETMEQVLLALNKQYGSNRHQERILKLTEKIRIATMSKDIRSYRPVLLVQSQ